MSGFKELAALGTVAGGDGGASLVAALFNFVRRARGVEQRALAPEELASIASRFQIADARTALVCCDAAWRLIEETIRGAHTVESIAGLLAGSVPAQLASVLASVCAELQGQWKVDAIKSTVAVPRLVGVDWRVDVKTASSHAAGMGIPAVIMQLKVEGDRVVTMEMDKETLQAMLSGLGKIRDQLNRIA